MINDYFSGTHVKYKAQLLEELSSIRFWDLETFCPKTNTFHYIFTDEERRNMQKRKKEIELELKYINSIN